MQDFQSTLQKRVKGLFYFDPIPKRIYSVDASIFELEPLGAVLPFSKEDLIETLKIAYAYRVPVTARGAATGITGGCLGRGLIIDLSKINALLSINLEEKTVSCQPGMTQDDLNRQLRPYDLRLGPDTSTGNRATIGGMLANNAAGSRSLHYGRMVDHVLSVEVAKADGSLMTFGPLEPHQWQEKLSLSTDEGTLYREVDRIRSAYAKEIREKFPAIPRHVSGYNLDSLLERNPPNLAQLIAGSEGTLGIATAITMKASNPISHPGLCLFFFHDMLDAFSHVSRLLIYNPSAIELIDNQIIQLGRDSPAFKNELGWLPGDPKALLIMEIPGHSERETQEMLHRITAETKDIGYLQKNILERKQMDQIWAFRKAGLGILLSKRSYSRAVAFLEDVAVAPKQLYVFMSEFLKLLKRHGKTAGIYGHAGSGCMHIRPYMNLSDPQEVTLMREMMKETTSLLLNHGGTLSGEHGDGLIRSWLNPHLFGQELMQAFKEIKLAFDPEQRLNPGKIIPITDEFEEFRFVQKPLIEPATFLDFKREGGFALSVDLCNGNGLCRKKEKVMCPSFQATNQEFHSTRARAQALRGIITGRQPMGDLTSPDMHAVMDLCISCKGCKTECPSQIDMAKIKAEFLYHYQNKHGIPFRSHIFGSIGEIAEWSSPFAPVINYLQNSKFLKKGKEWVGLTSKRNLPLLARQKFSVWFKNTIQPPHLKKEAALFNDTFTEFFHPSIGQAAVQVLNAFGYRVSLIPWSCCGRPALSKGLLAQAKSQATKVLATLAPFVQKKIPIIGLEPSCLLTIRDDYEGLLKSNSLAASCFTLDEFLNDNLSNVSFQKVTPQKVLLHGHCYQKALVGMEPTLNVLKAVNGLDVSEIPSGCCGMAGSFGFEKEHYEISMKIGELVLFPTLLNTPKETVIVASGTSCRQQIFDGTNRSALHLAEILLNSIN
ncbi:MAG: FAD-binding protein [Parachlamydia sp.]|nr:FAD-binding protein [Parachlamydia sp.]